MDLVRSIGADQVIDYTQQDFLNANKRYDIIFDNVGNHSLSACRRLLHRKGINLMVGILGDRGILSLLTRLVTALLWSRFISQKFIVFIAKLNKQDLTLLGELMATRKVTPVIDKCYSLNQVPEAIRYLSEHHARGKVVITLQ